MKTIMNKVEEVLKTYPKTRNNDNRLVGTYWYVWHKELVDNLNGKPCITFENLLKVPSFESIRRCRQKLQEQGKYQASKPVQKFRKQKKAQIEQGLKNNTIKCDVET